MRRRPKVLYRYCRPERIDVLTSGQIGFQSVGLLNDPFENQPVFVRSRRFEQAFTENWPVVQHIRRNYLGGTFREIRRALGADLHARVGLYFQKKYAQAAWVQLYLRGLGVLCLSETRDNLLMWAHYAGAHEGFIIGLRSNARVLTEGNVGLKPVRYSSIRLRQRLFENFLLGELVLRKGTQWAYEREWRAVRYWPKDDVKFDKRGCVPLYRLPARDVAEVIVGCRMPRPFFLRLLRLLQKPKYQHVRVYRAEIAENTFKLRFRRVYVDRLLRARAKLRKADTRARSKGQAF